MSELRFKLEEVTDPDEIARHRRISEAGWRNSDWLASHWSELLPDVRGRFVAVAGQQAFVADTPEEAIALAQAAHPDGLGLIIQYVIPERGWRIYVGGLSVLAIARTADYTGRRRASRMSPMWQVRAGPTTR